MIAKTGKKRAALRAALILLACLAIGAVSVAINLPEATGKTVKKKAAKTEK